jgi:hypothetical protein
MFLELTDLDYGRDAGVEPPAAELAARTACLDVALSAFYLIDAGKAEQTLPLFTYDGVHTFNGVEFTGPGLAEMARMRDEKFRAGRNTRHAISSTVFRMLEPGKALLRMMGAVYLLQQEDEMLRRIPGGIVDFTDTLVRGADGRWRIARREANLAAINAEQQGLHENGFATDGGR